MVSHRARDGSAAEQHIHSPSPRPRADARMLARRSPAGSGSQRGRLCAPAGRRRRDRVHGAAAPLPSLRGPLGRCLPPGGRRRQGIRDTPCRPVQVDHVTDHRRRHRGRGLSGRARKRGRWRRAGPRRAAPLRPRDRPRLRHRGRGCGSDPLVPAVLPARRSIRFGRHVPPELPAHARPHRHARLRDPNRQLVDGAHPPQVRSREAAGALGESRERATGGEGDPRGRARPRASRDRVADALRRAVPRSDAATRGRRFSSACSRGFAPSRSTRP